MKKCIECNIVGQHGREVCSACTRSRHLEELKGELATIPGVRIVTDKEWRTILKGVAGGVLLALAVLFAHPSHAAAYSYAYQGQSPYGHVEKDGSTTAYLTIQNTGPETWCRDCATPTRLGTDNTRDRASAFKGSDWLSYSRIPMQEATVAPGQSAHFVFHLGNAGATRVSNEYFTPVVDGVTWMANIGLYWQWVNPPDYGNLLFLWYGPGEHRWTDTTEKAIDNPHFGTINGHYTSSDPNVMRQQLQALHDMGVHGPGTYVALDWWHEEAYGQGAYIRANAYAAAHMIINEFPDMHFTFFEEPRCCGLNYVPASDYNDFWNEFGNSPQWYRWNGKPTLFTYSIQPTYDARFDQLWDYPGSPTRPRTMTVSFDNLRYCAVLGSPCIYQDGAQTGSQYNSERDNILATRGNYNTVIQYWNEYYERSQSEPADRPDGVHGANFMYTLMQTDFIPRLEHQ